MGKLNPSLQKRHARGALVGVGGDEKIEQRRSSTRSLSPCSRTANRKNGGSSNKANTSAIRSSRPRQHIPSTLESLGCEPQSKFDDHTDQHNQKRSKASLSSSIVARYIHKKQPPRCYSDDSSNSSSEDERSNGNITNRLPVVSPPSSHNNQGKIQESANCTKTDVEVSGAIELLDDDDSYDDDSFDAKKSTAIDSDDSSILEVYSICSGDSSSIDSIIYDNDPPTVSDCYLMDEMKKKKKKNCLHNTQQPQRYYYSSRVTSSKNNMNQTMSSLPIVHNNNNNCNYHYQKSNADLSERTSSAATAMAQEFSHGNEASRRKNPYCISPGEKKYFQIERRQSKQIDSTNSSLKSNGYHQALGSSSFAKNTLVQDYSRRILRCSSDKDEDDIEIINHHRSSKMTQVEHHYGQGNHKPMLSEKQMTCRKLKEDRHNRQKRKNLHSLSANDEDVETKNDLSSRDAAKRGRTIQQFYFTTSVEDEAVAPCKRTAKESGRLNSMNDHRMVYFSEEEEDAALVDPPSNNKKTMMRQKYLRHGKQISDKEEYATRKNRESQEWPMDKQKLRCQEFPQVVYSSSEEGEDDDPKHSQRARKATEVKQNHHVRYNPQFSPEEDSYVTVLPKRSRKIHAKEETPQHYEKEKIDYSSGEDEQMTVIDGHSKKLIQGRERHLYYGKQALACSAEKGGQPSGNTVTAKQRYQHQSCKKPTYSAMEDEDVTIKNYRVRGSDQNIRRQGKSDKCRPCPTPDNNARVEGGPSEDDDYKLHSSGSIHDGNPNEQSEDESYEPSPYERFRNEKVRRNQEYLASLGLVEIKESLTKNKTPNRKGRTQKIISNKFNSSACSQLPSEPKEGVILSKKSKDEDAQIENSIRDSLGVVGDGEREKAVIKRTPNGSVNGCKPRRLEPQEYLPESLSEIKEINQGIHEEQMSCFFYARSGELNKEVMCDFGRDHNQHPLSNEKRNTLRGATGKLERCMQCVACLRRNDCLQCTYCRDNLRNGGAYLRKCALRRCVAPLPPRIYNKDDDMEESLEVCKNILTTTKGSMIGEALLQADVKSLFGSNLSPYRLLPEKPMQNGKSSATHAKPQQQKVSNKSPLSKNGGSSSTNMDEDSLSDRIVLEGIDDSDDDIRASCVDEDFNGRRRIIENSSESPNQAPRLYDLSSSNQETVVNKVKHLTSRNNRNISPSGKSGADFARSLMSFQRSVLQVPDEAQEAEFSGDDVYNLLVA
jgi:hypothetical protein